MPLNSRLAIAKDARLNISPQRLALELGCPDWDVLCLGDGSGTGGWSMSGGWACCTIERRSGARHVSFGGWSHCSILVAELSAYLQALMTLEVEHGPDLRRQLGRGLKVLIVTDNQPIAVQAARGLVGGSVGGDTGPIWAALRELSGKTGSVLDFKFAPRMSTQLNWAVDQLAGKARKLFGAWPDPPQVLSRGEPVPFAALNPD